MDFQTLRRTLDESKVEGLTFAIGRDRTLEPHFHVTEVGRVVKDFVDCGGVRRSVQTCVLQTLVAGDIDHRLTPNKLSKILSLSNNLDIDERSRVEVEVQGQTIETYTLDGADARGNSLVLHLTAKHTACLDMQKCGIPAMPVLDQTACGPTGCC